MFNQLKPVPELVLDQASTDALICELRHRYRLAKAERCTYCGGKASDPLCAHIDRHRGGDRSELLQVVALISAEPLLGKPEL